MFGELTGHRAPNYAMFGAVRCKQGPGAGQGPGGRACSRPGAHQRLGGLGPGASRLTWSSTQSDRLKNVERHERSSKSDLIF